MVASGLPRWHLDYDEKWRPTGALLFILWREGMHASFCKLVRYARSASGKCENNNFSKAYCDDVRIFYPNAHHYTSFHRMIESCQTAYGKRKDVSTFFIRPARDATTLPTLTWCLIRPQPAFSATRVLKMKSFRASHVYTVHFIPKRLCCCLLKIKAKRTIKFSNWLWSHSRHDWTSEKCLLCETV